MLITNLGLLACDLRVVRRSCCKWHQPRLAGPLAAASHWHTEVMKLFRGWESMRAKEEKAHKAAQAIFEQEQRAVAEELEKANRGAKAAKDDAERAEIFKLLSEAGGDDSDFFARRRRSMSKNSMPAGARFADERNRPQSIETERINECISSKAQNISSPSSSFSDPTSQYPTHASSSFSEPPQATGVRSPSFSDSELLHANQAPPMKITSSLSGNAMPSPSRKSPQTTSELLTPSRRQVRESHDEMRKLSSFREAPTQVSDSEVLEQVKRKMREQEERRAERAEIRKAAETEKAALAAANAKEAAYEGVNMRASPTAKRARAKAAAKVAGGVFLEMQEYNSLLSHLRSLELQVTNHKAAIGGPQANVDASEAPRVQVHGDGSDGSVSPTSLAMRLSPSSLARKTRSLSPSLSRPNSFVGHAMQSSEVYIDTPKKVGFDKMSREPPTSPIRPPSTRSGSPASFTTSSSEASSASSSEASSESTSRPPVAPKKVVSWVERTSSSYWNGTAESDSSAETVDVETPPPRPRVRSVSLTAHEA